MISTTLVVDEHFKYQNLRRRTPRPHRIPDEKKSLMILTHRLRKTLLKDDLQFLTISKSFPGVKVIYVYRRP